MFQWIHFTRCRSWLTAIVLASASLPWGNLLLCLFLVALIRSAPRCVRRATGQLLSSLIFYSSQRFCLRALLQRRICGLNYFELHSFCIASAAFFSTSIWLPIPTWVAIHCFDSTLSSQTLSRLLFLSSASSSTPADDTSLLLLSLLISFSRLQPSMSEHRISVRLL